MFGTGATSSSTTSRSFPAVDPSIQLNASPVFPASGISSLLPNSQPGRIPHASVTASAASTAIAAAANGMAGPPAASSSAPAAKLAGKPAPTDFSCSYSVSMLLGEAEVNALTRYEYAVLTGQPIAAGERDFDIAWVTDQSVVESNPEALAEDNSRKIQTAVTSALVGRAAFLAVSNYRHWAMIALLPCGSNGEIDLVYMNSAYGKGAEGYFGCKRVGFTLCQSLVAHLGGKLLHDRQARPPVISTHIYLEPTQQIENNCGAVMALNIASIAGWFRSTGGRGPIPLEHFLACQQYNIILQASDNKAPFEALVKAKFAGMRTSSAGRIPAAPAFAAGAAAPLSRSTMDASYYAHIKAQIDRDRLAAEAKQKAQQTALSESYDIAQQQAELEYYEKLKAGKHQAVPTATPTTSELSDRQATLQKEIHQLDTAIRTGSSSSNASQRLADKQKELAAITATLARLPASATATAPAKHPSAAAQTPAQANNKESDLLALLDILKIIDNAFLHPALLRAVLIQIGEAVRGEKISYQDKNKACIRNRYGYIDRASGNRVNTEGIPFDKLFNLGVFLKENPSFVFGEVDQTRIKGELQHLYQKIAYVIEAERQAKQCSEALYVREIQGYSLYRPAAAELGGKLTHIIECADRLFDQAILKKIADEFRLLGQLAFDFRNKYHRYYFARVFTKVGELAHEYRVYKGQTGWNPHFIKACENLDHIRSKLIHLHTLIRDGSDDTAHINDQLVLVVKQFSAVVAIDARGKVVINLNPTQQQALAQSTGEILKQLKDKERHPKVDEKKAEEKATEEKKEGTAAPKKDPAAPLKNLIVKFLNKLDEPADKRRKDYNVFLKKQIQEPYALLRAKLAADLPYPAQLNVTDRVQLKALVDGSVNKPKPVITPEDSAAAVAAKKAEQARHKAKKTANRIRRIDQEITLLQAIEQSATLPAQLKDYVTQHIVTVVGQYVRDLEELEAAEDIDAVSSRTLDEAAAQAKKSRNDGLAHNIFSFDLTKFATVMREHILPAQQDFMALKIVYENLVTGLPNTIVAMNNLAVAYTRLGHYAKAEQYLQRVLDFYVSETQQQRAAAAGVERKADGDFIDAEVIGFGADQYEIELTNNLLHTLYSQAKYDRAAHVIECYLAKLTLPTDLVAGENFRLAILDSILPFIETAPIRYPATFKQIIAISKALIPNVTDWKTKWRYYLACNRYFAHQGLNKEAAEMLKAANATFADSDSEEDPRFHISTHLQNIDALLHNDELSKAYQLILKTEKIVAGHSAKLKGWLGDRHVVGEMSVIDRKLALLARLYLRHKGSLGKPPYAAILAQLPLPELEQQVLQFQTRLKPRPHPPHELGKLYRDLSLVYSSRAAALLYSSTVAQNTAKPWRELEQAETHLKTAKTMGLTNSDLEEAAADLADMLIMCATRNEHSISDSILDIQLFTKALALRQQYQLDTNTNLLGLGLTHFSIGAKLDRAGYLEKAIENFTHAVKCLSKLPHTFVAALPPDSRKHYDYALGFSAEQIAAYSRAKPRAPRPTLSPIEQQQIEKAVCTRFAALRLSPICTDATLKIDLHDGMSKAALIAYCKSHLQLARADLDFDGETCMLSLNTAAIAKLRHKIPSAA